MENHWLNRWWNFKSDSNPRGMLPVKLSSAWHLSDLHVSAWFRLVHTSFWLHTNVLRPDTCKSTFRVSDLALPPSEQSPLMTLTRCAMAASPRGSINTLTPGSKSSASPSSSRAARKTSTWWRPAAGRQNSGSTASRRSSPIWATSAASRRASSILDVTKPNKKCLHPCFSKVFFFFPLLREDTAMCF